MEKRIKEIKHITCDAQNCMYNDNEACKCMAGSIRVGTQNACTCGETACATFRLNEDAIN